MRWVMRRFIAAISLCSVLALPLVAGDPDELSSAMRHIGLSVSEKFTKIRDALDLNKPHGIIDLYNDLIETQLKHAEMEKWSSGDKRLLACLRRAYSLTLMY